MTSLKGNDASHGAADDDVHSIVKNFLTLERLHRDYLSKSLHSEGLSASHAKHLLSIRRHPGENQDFWADYHAVDKSRIARVARELEELGLLERRADPQDRRRYLLFLTKSGDEAAGKAQAASDEWGARTFASFSAQDRARFHESLKRMLLVARQAAAPHGHAKGAPPV